LSIYLKSGLFIFLIFFWALNFSTNIVSANSNETSFIVTAYYSPLPNQKRYSYSTYTKRYRTYTEEKRLQWEWHTTASWKWVYTWILAAPAKYPFWTKIYFEGYGIGVIEDRWWAIVKAWKRWYEHDRIDIWMWYGEEWLMRATKWGKRKVKWKVVSRDSNINLKFKDDIFIGLNDIEVNPENKKARNVKILQANLKRVWLYKWKTDWKYETVKQTIIDFQIQNKVIENSNSKYAWWFWSRTYITLLKKYSLSNPLLQQNTRNIKDTNAKVQIILNHGEIKLNWDDPQVLEVKKTQELFKKLWMYNWNIDGNFNSIKKTLLDFQIKAWIIKNDNDWGAWYFWEKTKSALITHFENLSSNRKKKIPLDDISYASLDKVW